MEISEEIKKIIEGASGKALATKGPAGLNVVPVSMVKVNRDSIWLFNFFMNKTSRNLMAGGEVALACWDGLSGVQLKAQVEYIDSGDLFQESVAWVATQNLDRVVRGLIVLSPVVIYDVTADLERAGKVVSG